MPTKTAPAAQATLATRLADAEQAETAPRQRANALRASLDAAIASGEYGVADKLKGELAEARAVLALAEAGTVALRTASASADADRAEVDRVLADAEAKGEARRVIGAAMDGERRALAEVDSAIEEMRGHLDAARAAWRSAIAWEFKCGAERQRVINARVVLGEIPAPGPTPPRPNRASVLADSDDVVRALANSH